MNSFYDVESELICSVDALGAAGGGASSYNVNDGKDLKNINNAVQASHDLTEAQKEQILKALEQLKSGQDPKNSGAVELPRPGRSAMGVDNLMADIAVAIAKMQTDMRKQNRDMQIKETENTINEMNEQAKSIESKAAWQFAFSLAAGILTIGSGVLSLTGSIRGFGELSKAGSENLKLARMENTTKFWDAFAKGAEGLGQVSNSIGGYIATMKEADIKRSEARQQWHQSLVDNLKSYSDSCKEVADRAMNVADSVLQSSNQSRQRILG